MKSLSFSRQQNHLCRGLPTSLANKDTTLNRSHSDREMSPKPKRSHRGKKGKGGPAGLDLRGKAIPGIGESAKKSGNSENTRSSKKITIVRPQHHAVVHQQQPRNKCSVRPRTGRVDVGIVHFQGSTATTMLVENQGEDRSRLRRNTKDTKDQMDL